jgi:hypothetical protein
VDDLVPGSLELDQDAVLANAFVSEDSGKSFLQYRMRMSLSRTAAEAYHNSEWSSLMPDPASSEWLTINRANKEIQIRFS